MSNFKHSTIFAKEILSISLIFAVASFLLLHVSYPKYLFILIIILIFDLIALNSIGYKRRKEIEEIKSVIKSIRKNKISSESEISLSKSLITLEGNIKAMFRRTQQDLANVKKLAQARSEFLGYVSHELRTPIFTIQGYLETLLSGAVNDKKVNRVFLTKALNHSENLNTLLNDLIDISMIESGLMSLSFRYFNLNNFLIDIIENSNDLEKKEKVSIHIKEFREELEVYGDKEKLRQVITNLLSNAVKYTDEGKIEIIVEEKNKSVIIKIKDTGKGIPEEDFERVFERFYRTDRERAGSTPGTGLGLSIVKHILGAHKTNITLESKLNEGSTFSFKLKK
ncbi:MAG: two-component sensor histidine kinase [Ignavibacteriae bacterium]|nr:MAG: two-component sensor histidine kinase [Ignavibacteriota bacterium]